MSYLKNVTSFKPHALHFHWSWTLCFRYIMYNYTDGLKREPQKSLLHSKSFILSPKIWRIKGKTLNPLVNWSLHHVKIVEVVQVYDQFQQIVQTMNVMSNEWKLLWQEWMYWKNRIFTMFMIFSKTSFTSKSVYFTWSQLQHRIKSWNYVLEFKCSQNIRYQDTRKVTISIELPVEIFKAQTLTMVWPLCKDICFSEFWRGMNAFSEKAEHYEVLSISVLPSRIFCIKTVIVACSYGVSNSESVHSHKQRQQAVQLCDRIFHFESRGISKNLSPYHNAKTQSERNETLDVMKYLKISVIKRFF